MKAKNGAPKVGRLRPGRWRRPFLPALLAYGLLLGLRPAGADPRVLDALGEDLLTKASLEKTLPAAARVFDAQTPSGDLPALLPDLAKTRFEAPYEAWRQVALGLALESRGRGEGKGAFEAAAAAFGNRPAALFAAARLVAARGLDPAFFQSEMQRHLLAAGHVRVPELAKIALFEARRALDQKKGSAAEASRGEALALKKLALAEELDPFCPWIPLLRLEMAIRGKKMAEWNMGEMGRHLGAFFGTLRYYEVRALFFTNLLRTLRLTLGLFFVLGALILLIRHFTKATHLLAERLPRQVDLPVRYLALALLFASLAVAGFGLIALTFIATVFLWTYLGHEEKRFFKTFLYACLFLPFLLLAESSFLKHADPEEPLAFYRTAVDRGFDEGFRREALALAPASPADRGFGHLALSVQEKKRGNLVEAERQAAKAQEAFGPLLERGRAGSLVPARLEGPGGSYAGLLALISGNLELLRYDYDKAGGFYQKAQETDPDRLETWFNSSQLALFSSRSGLHKTYLDKAGEIDPSYLTTFLRQNDAHFDSPPAVRRVMDPRLKAGSLPFVFFEDLMAFRFGMAQLRTGLFELPPLLLFAVALGLLLFLSIYHHQPRHLVQGKKVFECKICGKATCRLCRKGVHCQNCFKIVSGITDQRLRNEIVGRLKSRGELVPALLQKALDAAFPGAGRVYHPAFEGGFSLFLLSCLFFAFGYQANHLVKEYPDFALAPFAGLAWAPMLLLYAVTWARIALSGFSPRPRTWEGF